MKRSQCSTAEGRDDIDLEDLLDDEMSSSSEKHGQSEGLSCSLRGAEQYDSVAAVACPTPQTSDTDGSTKTPWNATHGSDRGHSLEAIMKDQAEEQVSEEKETVRLAELAQEEELVQMALHMSMTDMSSNHSANSYSHSDFTSGTADSEQEQLERAIRASRQEYNSNYSTLGVLEEDRPISASISVNVGSGGTGFGGLSVDDTNLSPRIPSVTTNNQNLTSPGATLGYLTGIAEHQGPTPSSHSSSSSSRPRKDGYRSHLIRQLGSSFQSLEELSPADFSPKSTVNEGRSAPDESILGQIQTSIETASCHLEEAAILTSLAPPSPPSRDLQSNKPCPPTPLDEISACSHLSPGELALIKQALSQPDTGRSSPEAETCAVTDAEALAIEKALREADLEAENKSLMLALQIQEEESRNCKAQSRPQSQGNVRTMTRAQYAAEQGRAAVGAFQSTGPLARHPLEDEESGVSSGFRINSANQQQWNRLDQHSVIGPDNEIRTKHDTELHGRANAHRLGLDTEESLVGNKAFNSFMQSVRRKNKGVAAHGTGRAGSDADSTRGGAIDPKVRVLISKAVNNGLIEKCNGVVKEGKEAVVYHAECGEESEGFDVAVKVFKRIQEFRARGDYVDGDPRYFRANFRNSSDREQLELWTEKEYRNLMRANKAGVPVPTPLMQKDNVLFMRFMGTGGWPAPQLRELEIRKGSSKWKTMFQLCLAATQRLYNKARLVHGDLSEYNIMVVPSQIVENTSDGLQDDDLQPVLIDFGQAVDVRHPDAKTLLERDIKALLSFFQRQEVETMTLVEAMSFVVNEAELKKI